MTFFMCCTDELNQQPHTSDDENNSGTSSVSEEVAAPNIEYVGRRVAKKFTPDDGSEDQLFFGFVQSKERLLRRRRPRSRLQQVWTIRYDDGDSEELNRFEVAQAIALAEQYGQGVGMGDDNEDGEGELDMAEPLDPDAEIFVVRAPFDNAAHHHEVAEEWLEPLSDHSDRNTFSYLVDLVRDKMKFRMTDAATQQRLKRETLAYAAKLPTDMRQLRKKLGSGNLQDVIRHRCMKAGCCFSWIGAVDTRSYNENDRCPDCDTKRYKRVSGKLVPCGVWYYFGISVAIAEMFRDPVFVAAWKKGMDATVNAFQNSKEAARLNNATDGEALARNNRVYSLHCDGFQARNDNRHNVTGECV